MMEPRIIRDKWGNQIEISIEGSIHLSLNGRRVFIGNVFRRNGKMVYSKSVQKKNVFRKFDAWGLNHAVVKLLPDEAEIVLTSDEPKIYRTTKEMVLVRGEFLHFLENNCELQIFMPRDAFQVEDV